MQIFFEKYQNIFNNKKYWQTNVYNGGGPLGYCTRGVKLRARLFASMQLQSSSADGTKEAAPSSKSITAWIGNEALNTRPMK